jgi:hypothetical protein
MPWVAHAIVGLHIQAGTEQSDFHAKREPDSFTDLITTACVLAQLDCSRPAFDWHFEVTRADELVT